MKLDVYSTQKKSTYLAQHDSLQAYLNLSLITNSRNSSRPLKYLLTPYTTYNTYGNYGTYNTYRMCQFYFFYKSPN